MTIPEVKARARARFGRELDDDEVAHLGRRLEVALSIADCIDGWLERLGAADPATVSGLVHHAGNTDEHA